MSEFEWPAAVDTGLRSHDPKWQEARRSGIGASEAAAVLGLDPYTDPLEIYSRKVPRADGSYAEDDFSSEAATWGLLLEPVIIEEYARRTKREAVHSGRMLRSIEHPHLFCTLDLEQRGTVRLASGPHEMQGIGQVKTTSLVKEWAEEVPVRTQVQVQQEMLVTGSEWESIIMLPLPSRELRIIEVQPHPQFQAWMAEQLLEFWQRVIERRPPPSLGTESSDRALAALYPEDSGRTIKLGREWLARTREIRALAELRKAIEKREAAIKSMLRETMQDATYGEMSDGARWSLKRTKASTSRCKACGAVTGERKAFRALRMNLPPKPRRQIDYDKPLEERSYFLDTDGSDRTPWLPAHKEER